MKEDGGRERGVEVRGHGERGELVFLPQLTTSGGRVSMFAPLIIHLHGETEASQRNRWLWFPPGDLNSEARWKSRFGKGQQNTKKTKQKTKKR